MRASRAFVSDALYERHRSQLEKMKRRGRANRIKDLVLSDIRVVRLEKGTRRAAGSLRRSNRGLGS